MKTIILSFLIFLLVACTPTIHGFNECGKEINRSPNGHFQDTLNYTMNITCLKINGCNISNIEEFKVNMYPLC